MEAAKSHRTYKAAAVGRPPNWRWLTDDGFVHTTESAKDKQAGMRPGAKKTDGSKGDEDHER